MTKLLGPYVNLIGEKPDGTHFIQFYLNDEGRAASVETWDAESRQSPISNFQRPYVIYAYDVREDRYFALVIDKDSSIYRFPYSTISGFSKGIKYEKKGWDTEGTLINPYPFNLIDKLTKLSETQIKNIPIENYPGAESPVKENEEASSVNNDVTVNDTNDDWEIQKNENIDSVLEACANETPLTIEERGISEQFKNDWMTIKRSSKSSKEYCIALNAILHGNVADDTLLLNEETRNNAFIFRRDYLVPLLDKTRAHGPNTQEKQIAELALRFIEQLMQIEMLQCMIPTADRAPSKKHEPALAPASDQHFALETLYNELKSTQSIIEFSSAFLTLDIDDQQRAYLFEALLPDLCHFTKTSKDCCDLMMLFDEKEIIAYTNALSDSLMAFCQNMDDCIMLLKAARGNSNLFYTLFSSILHYYHDCDGKKQSQFSTQLSEILAPELKKEFDEQYQLFKRDKESIKIITLTDYSFLTKPLPKVQYPEQMAASIPLYK